MRLVRPRGRSRRPLPSPVAEVPATPFEDVVFLDVPFVEKDEAKALGARWDPAARRWFIPGGHDSSRFARWLPGHAGFAVKPAELGSNPAGTVAAAVVGLHRTCYRCGAAITSVVGVLVPPDLSLDPSGFIDLESCARAIADAFNDAPERTRCRIGRLLPRTSRILPEGYVANGCFECDAIQGSFPLQEELTGYLAGGGGYERLIVAEVELPLAAIPSLDDDREDEDGSFAE